LQAVARADVDDAFAVLDCLGERAGVQFERKDDANRPDDS